MFEVEQKFYESRKNEFREKYLNKRLVIQGEEIKGIYDSDEEALKDSVAKNMVAGTFMIKWVKATDDDEIVRFFNRIYA